MHIDICFIYVLVSIGFRYNRYRPNYVVKDTGRDIGGLERGSLRDCESLCFDTTLCKSFSFCPRSKWNEGQCWLKDKVFDGTEKLADQRGWCTSHYESPSM